METSLIAPLGLTPPVVTEFIQYLDLIESSLPDNVFLMITEDKEVIEGAELVRTAVSIKYPRCNVIVIKLPFFDLDKQDKVWEFTRLAGNLLVQQRSNYRAKKVYVLISGGRKTMGVYLAMLCQIFPVTGVYHVVAKDVKIANERLEALRGMISRLSEISDRKKFYLANREDFDLIMWPALTEYSVVKLPVIPYPPELIKSLVDLLTTSRSRKTEISITKEILTMMGLGGLVQIVGGWIIPTEQGRFFGEALRSVL